MKDTTRIDDAYQHEKSGRRFMRFNAKYSDLEKSIMREFSTFSGWDYNELFVKAYEIYVNPDANPPEKETINVFAGGSAFDVSGSVGDVMDTPEMKKVLRIGTYAGHLHRSGFPLQIITGGTPIKTMPFQFAKAAKLISPTIPVIGVRGEGHLHKNSSFADKEYRELFDLLLSYDFSDLPLIGHDGRFYMPLLYRNPINVSLADNDNKGGILISLMGGSGTLNEISLGYHQRLICAFYNQLNGASSGVKHTLDHIFESGQKPERMVYFEDNDPERMLLRAIAEYQAKQLSPDSLSRISVYENVNGKKELHIIMRPPGRHITRRHPEFKLLRSAVFNIPYDQLLAETKDLGSIFHDREPNKRYHEEGRVMMSTKFSEGFDLANNVINSLIIRHEPLYREQNLTKETQCYLSKLCFR